MKTSLLLLTIMLSVSLFACTANKDEPFTPPTSQPGGGNGSGSEDAESPDKPPQNSDMMKITIGRTSFAATFADNPSAAAFRAMLPLSLDMSELNNNEKYYNLPSGLPSSASSVATIQSGNIMLFGSSTLVLFYKTFSTSYSYTRIAKVDNPSGLQAALGAGSVTVKFELN